MHVPEHVHAHPPRRRTPSRWAAATTAAATAAAALVLAVAGPAAAHVTVSSPDAAPGGFGKLVFRVPSESDTASTTKVEVTLPQDTPFAFVSSKPVAGWTVRTTERTLPEPVETEGFTLTKAVSTVTWTAEKGQGLAPHEFGEFELSVGPFPKKASALAMPAAQTYSDGSVTRWDQPSKEGGQEPEHPAPTLELAAEKAPAVTTASTGGDDDLARWLSGGALLLGAAALGVAVSGRRRSAEPRA